MKNKEENKYKRIIIHRICKYPLEFDIFGNWKCKKCNKVKRYKFDDKELEIIEDGS